MGLSNSNLIQLLATVEDSELKKIVQFAKSPFHNSNKLIIELLKELLIFHPKKFQHKRLTKEIIFRKIHPEGTTYHEGRMNLLMTQLVKLAERFFMYQELEKDEILKTRLQGQGFKERGFYKKYKKEVESSFNYLDNSCYQNENYYYQTYFLNEDIFFQIETDKLGNGQQHLRDAMKNLDLFFMTSKIKLSAELLTRASTHNEILDIKYLEETLELLSNSNYESSILLSIYHKILLLRLNEFDNDIYQQLKNLFFKEIESLDLKSQRGVFLNLININIIQLNKGNRTAIEEVFKLYQIGFVKNLILNNNKITEYTYYNIVSISSVFKEYEWCHNFIIKNEKYLHRSDAFQIKSYALATLYYVMGSNEHPKHFYTTMKVLREATGNRKNSLIIINSKSLLIRSYFELLSIDESYNTSLDMLLINFNKQIKNNSLLSKSRIDSFLAFSRYTKELLQLKNSKTIHQSQIDDFNILLDSDKNVKLKHWLKQKSEELLPNSSEVS